MSAVAYYLERGRSGDLEGALCGLRELGDECLPAMQEAYFREQDPFIRSMIVEAIWQHRRPSTVTFLADALRDSGSIVWKQALDGLVTLASSESIQVL